MISYNISINTLKISVTFKNNELTQIGRPNELLEDFPELKNQEGNNGRNIIKFFEYFFDGDFQKSDEIKRKIEIELDGTEFQKRVWNGIKNIDTGTVLSYKELAEKIGSKAVQAVGTACGKNPLPMLIPCHRVIASGGKLGGRSGKIDKEILIKNEGIFL